MHYIAHRTRCAPFVVSCACGHRTVPHPSPLSADEAHREHVTETIQARLMRRTS